MISCSKTHSADTLSHFVSASDKSSDPNPILTDDQKEVQTENEDLQTVSCDKCDKNAVCYCTECDRKLCSTHEDVSLTES